MNKKVGETKRTGFNSQKCWSISRASSTFTWGEKKACPAVSPREKQFFCSFEYLLLLLGNTENQIGIYYVGSMLVRRIDVLDGVAVESLESHILL